MAEVCERRIAMRDYIEGFVGFALLFGIIFMMTVIGA